MIAPPCEGAHGALGMPRVEADHVDDRIELARLHLALKGAEVVAIAGDCFNARGQAIFALASIEEGDLGVALDEMLDDAGADEARAAEEQYVHTLTLPFRAYNCRPRAKIQ